MTFKKRRPKSFLPEPFLFFVFFCQTTAPWVDDIFKPQARVGLESATFFSEDSLHYKKRLATPLLGIFFSAHESERKNIQEIYFSVFGIYLLKIK